MLALLITNSSLTLLPEPDIETDAEKEPKDRQQFLELDSDDGHASVRAPGIGSLLNLPSWLTNLFTPSAEQTTTLSHFTDVFKLWTRAQDFVDRLGKAETVDDRLRQVLGWVQ